MVVPAGIPERTTSHDTGSAAPSPAAKSPDAPSEDGFGLVRALDERGNVRPLADVENEMIRLAIEHYKGQMSEVARRLGIGRSTLYRKLKEMGIEPEEGRTERMAS
jgi:DNA-binding NtrC family response regulator